MNKMNKYGKPFLKWAGGKSRLLSTLLANAPENYNKYFELFLGGGALFFALNPKEAVLADLNSDLVETYIAVQLNPKLVIEELKKMKNSESDYYRIRSHNYRTDYEKAAQFIYLNKLCYNGIYRVNNKGVFNVPYCKDESRHYFSEKEILRASEILQNTKLISSDFESFGKDIQKNDFVYVDPPYALQRKNNGFLEYNKKIFHWEDQIRLSRFVAELSQKGAKILISNVNAAEIIELYPNFEMVEAYRNCTIGGYNASRKLVKEIILKNY